MVPFLELRLTCLVSRPYHLVAAGPKMTTRLCISFRSLTFGREELEMRTTAVSSHTRRSHRVMRLEATLLDELLG
jgi:hypothetical protein